MIHALAALALMWCVTVLPGCGRGDEYGQETAQQTLETALKMIRAGDAERLPTLVYAEQQELKIILARLGTLLGSVEDLAGELKRRFPQQVEAMRARALQAAKGDQGRRLLSAVTGGPGGPRRGGPQGEAAQREQRRAFEETVGLIFADPFGFIDANAQRLTVISTADDTAAVLLDGQPVPPVGMTMRRAEDGRWFFELPLNLPMVGRFMPQTRYEWSIVGSLIKALDGTVRELTEDVRRGALSRPEQVAEKAGEKAFIPLAMIFVAYGKEAATRGEREKHMEALGKRQRAWRSTRVAAGQDARALDALLQTVSRVAVERLDVIVRREFGRDRDGAPSEVPAFDALDDAGLEAQMAAWLAEAGVPGVDFSGAVDAAMARSVAERVSAAQKARRGR